MEPFGRTQGSFRRYGVLGSSGSFRTPQLLGLSPVDMQATDSAGFGDLRMLISVLPGPRRSSVRGGLGFRV